MTTTVPPGLDERIAAFASAVRAHLDDLDTEDIDDLIDGLEADLTDQAADNGDGFMLPDAGSYAAELRSAAGLPPRPAGSPKRSTPFASVGAWSRDQAAQLMATRTGAAVIGFLIALRPVWWVARGWALFALIGGMLGLTSQVVGLPWNNLGGWLLLGALVILSVQWGRGRWAPYRWTRSLRQVVSVVTAITLPFLVVSATSTVQQIAYDYAHANDYNSAVSTPGLAIDGQRVRNIFAYDATGNPLPGVQLFDQDGRPLTTVDSTSRGEPIDAYFNCGGGPVPIATTIAGRTPLWNSYPLQEVAPASANACADTRLADATVPVFPFPIVPAIPAGSASTPSPGATPQPSATTGAGPTATPSPTPTTDR